MNTEIQQACRDCARDILLSCEGDVTRVEYAAAKIAARVLEESARWGKRVDELEINLGAMTDERDQLRIALDLAHESENQLAAKINSQSQEIFRCSEIIARQIKCTL